MSEVSGEILRVVSQLPNPRLVGAKIYGASRTADVSIWRGLREQGWRITSTWIDEAEVGATKSWPDLWHRCVTEASECDALILLAQDGLKGGLVEVGAALAKGRRVFVVRRNAADTRAVTEMVGSWTNHPRVIICDGLHDALAHISNLWLGFRGATRNAADIVGDYKRGDTLQMIGTRYLVSMEAVRKLLIAEGVKIRPKGRRPK